MASPPRSLLLLAVSAAVLAVALRYLVKRPHPPRIWTADELAKHNGTDESLPILLGILGSVFDVTKGRSHYGPGGGYHHFAGRDASRAFVSGNFTGDGLTDTLQGLTGVEMKGVVDWRSFYFKNYIRRKFQTNLPSGGKLVQEHFYNTKEKTLLHNRKVVILTMSNDRFTGKLVGRYYDSQGNPTKFLKGVEAKAARGAQLLEKQKAEEAKIPGCNSKWSENEGGEVWCDEGYPRLMQRPLEIALTGKMSQRCACFKQEELDQPGLEVYKGCDPLSKSCKLE